MSNPIDLSALVVREATPTDASVISQQRCLMFEDMGFSDHARLGDMRIEFEDWVSEKLAEGEYRGWLMTDPFGAVIAGAGLWIMEWLPTPVDLSEERGYVLNVYVRPEYRRKGIARILMQTILHWCRVHDIHTLSLHASPDGLDLYKQLGFQITNEMRYHFPETD